MERREPGDVIDEAERRTFGVGQLGEFKAISALERRGVAFRWCERADGVGDAVAVDLAGLFELDVKIIFEAGGDLRAGNAVRFEAIDSGAARGSKSEVVLRGSDSVDDVNREHRPCEC